MVSESTEERDDGEELEGIISEGLGNVIYFLILVCLVENWRRDLIRIDGFQQVRRLASDQTTGCDATTTPARKFKRKQTTKSIMQ